MSTKAFPRPYASPWSLFSLRLKSIGPAHSCCSHNWLKGSGCHLSRYESAKCFGESTESGSEVQKSLHQSKAKAVMSSSKMASPWHVPKIGCAPITALHDGWLTCSEARRKWAMSQGHTSTRWGSDNSWKIFGWQLNNHMGSLVSYGVSPPPGRSFNINVQRFSWVCCVAFIMFSVDIPWRRWHV